MNGKISYRVMVATTIMLAIVFALFSPPPVQAEGAVPKYEVDPFWLKIPAKWVIGPLGGSCICVFRTIPGTDSDRKQTVIPNESRQ